MQKKSFDQYPVTIEIIHNYVVVRCQAFGISISAGQFSPDIPSPHKIGEAYYKVLMEVVDQVEGLHQELSQKTKKDPTLTLVQVSKILGTSVSSVRRLIDANLIECKKTKGKHRKPLTQSVYAYLKSISN